MMQLFLKIIIKSVSQLSLEIFAVAAQIVQLSLYNKGDAVC